MLFAAEGEEGTAVVHFKTWDSNYENMYMDMGTAEWAQCTKPRDAEQMNLQFTFAELKKVLQVMPFGFIAVR